MTPASRACTLHKSRDLEKDWEWRNANGGTGSQQRRSLHFVRGSAEKHRAHWNPTWPGGITVVVVVVGRVKLGQLCYHSRSYRSGFGTCLRLRGFHDPLSLKPRTILVPNALYDWPLSNNRSVGRLSHRLRWLRSRWSRNHGCRSTGVSNSLVRPSSIFQRPG